MSPEKIGELLRSNGLKDTPKRQLVARHVLASRAARTPEQVWHHLRPRLGELGLPTVYRVLQELAEIGIIAEIDLGDRNRRYATCRTTPGIHHHHIVCTKCRSVREIPTCAFNRQVRAIERTTGFRITGHRLQVDGVCPNCR